MLKSKFNFELVFIFLLCLHTALILSIDLFPFADVPSHLAEGVIFKHYGSDTNLFNKYYTIHYLFYPNTFHLLFFSLPIFPNVEIANKLLHLLTAVGLPILVFFILKELRANKWFAIVSFILIYGYNLTFGFTGNAVANDIVLLILLLWLRTINRNSNHAIYMVSISILLIIVYFLHAMVALFSMLMMASFLFYKYRNSSIKLILNSLSLLPLISLILYWWFFLQKQAETSTQYNKQESTFAFLKSYYQYSFLQTYTKRVSFLIADNFQLFDGKLGKVVAFTLSCVIFAPFIIFIYNYFKKNITITHFRFLNESAIYLILFFAVNCICFFLLPAKIPGQEPLYERFSTMLLLSIILMGSKLPILYRVSFSYVIITLAFIHLTLWAQYFFQFNQENKYFEQILPQDNTKILSYMNYDPAYRGRMVYDHFQNYFIVKKQGISTSKVIDYRFGMVRRKNSGGLPHQGHMYYRDSPRELLLKSDYILVRGIIPPRDQRLLDSMNTFVNVRNIYNWHLLKRK
ncbi:hypothetical protein F1C16_01215 [Hymenobacter sp. NBH84]|uniref:hypothetical protein n=1 Tax=Hymenobacter sp. NBH84 TaxID=2596915 RepID=UPI001623BD62|nr:hypothetical protein [Hymenobacter sp. NBH84]QNE38271.1 hypothetical protein F1C16_01215 [Hymenobacter sp. NBH84]